MDARSKTIAINNHFDSPCSRHLYAGFRADAGHDGLDWPVGKGTPVHAMYDGIVHSIQWNSRADAYGIRVSIRSQTDPTNSPDAGLEHAYAHLSEIDVYVGQAVSKGERLGWSGNTSKYATGNQLHVALLNPMWVTVDSLRRGSTRFLVKTGISIQNPSLRGAASTSGPSWQGHNLTLLEVGKPSRIRSKATIWSSAPDPLW